MIATDHQFTVAKDRLDKFRHNVTVLEQRAKTDPVASLQLRSAQASVTDLEAEIDEYQALAAGTVKDFAVATLSDLPTALIKARIARRLSQSDLAELLQLKPQQVQRWESQGYEHAAFSRLAEIAAILKVRLPERVELVGDDAPVPLSRVKRLLQRMGLPQEVIDGRILPRGLDGLFDVIKFDELDSRLDRLFGWRAPALATGTAALPTSQLKFKLPASAAQDRTRAYAAYVAGLCRIVAEAMPKSEGFSTSWQKTREAIFGDGEVSLRVAIDACWDRNIAVLPLRDSVAFHGAYWNAEGRTVIVLKQTSDEESRWLLDLLHEIFHHAVTPSAEGLSVLELDETAVERRESVEERRAHRFAAEVVTGGRYGDLTQRIVDIAGAHTPSLRAATLRVAEEEDLPTGVLANLLAWRLAEGGTSWWHVAAGLQDGRLDGLNIARQAFAERFSLEAVPRMERSLLVQALEVNDDD
jgi:ribosome-binding protein aMBF1 (putative translation factor)